MPRTKIPLSIIIIHTLFIFGVFLVSNKFYDRAWEKIDFLDEAEQAATVNVATNALERGLPWLEEHFADTVEIRVWQSNLNYLKKQPPQTLVSPQIKKSIAKNSEAIYSKFSPGLFWDVIRIAAFFMILLVPFLLFL